MTASGHRLTAWTRASSALYGGAPRGRVCGAGALLDAHHLSSIGEVAIHDLGGVEAETSREARSVTYVAAAAQSATGRATMAAIAMDLRRGVFLFCES